MAEPARRPIASSYDQDLSAWSEEQARLLRARSAGNLDWENLAEEIAELGNSGRNEIRNRMTVLLLHLLKWQFQPQGRTNSWAASILEQRERIAIVIEASPSLRTFPRTVLDKEYRIARLRASGETALPLAYFPAEIPYTIEEILDENFLPGGDA